MSSDRYSFLNAFHIKDIESIYEKFKINPNLVEPTWSAFFSGFDFGEENNKYNNNLKNIIKKNFLLYNLIQYYKNYGHFFAKKNPIEKNVFKFPFEKKLELHNDKEIKNHFYSKKMINFENISLKKTIHNLKNTYCGSIGLEYMHIIDYEKIQWIEKWFKKKSIKLSIDDKKNILYKLYKTISLENFIHKKFPGQKRFSIEGNESVLLALEDIIEFSSKQYLTETFVIGMAHRGRLNVISNLFNIDYSKIFSEFKEIEYKDKSFSGDVKYHLGFSVFRYTNLYKYIELNLVPNPSHLESVNPVVEGISRAKIDILYNGNSKKVIPILIHGDASLSGQGIVYEVLQLSKLKGYKTGGTIHIVINNQIGFTTDICDSRSSIYCTDVAKVVSSPVIHVNSEDIESVIHSIRFAIDYRMNYNNDIFIDLIGYRKYGHNESDEPRFTNPSIYKIISKKINCYDIYKEKLKTEKIIDDNEIQNIEYKQQLLLNKKYKNSKKIKWKFINTFLEDNKWKRFPIVFDDKSVFKKVNTKFPIETIIDIAYKIFTIPDNKNFIKKIKSIFKKRLKMINNNYVDWSMAELLSYGTLLYEGFNIRLSGEDVARGTFSQRHIVIKTEEEEELIILNNIINKNILSKVEVYNSPLSEYGVLGFDYGYSMVSPYVLNLWEAQFGDFSNGAQIIIDQYISSGEKKWKIKNGIVLLLPHGDEGQGPEHSSARIERYVQLCANNNLFIVNCTTPSNFYHLIRRQMKFCFRKPLIVFTPKSLLRNTKCISSIEDLSNGFFQEIMDDFTIKDSEKEKIEKIIICSGKIYYDLLDKRYIIKDNKTALIRIEQIYPLKIKKIINILDKYKNKKKIIWVQEEPSNMGLWSFISMKFRVINSLKLVSTPENSSPSTGSYADYLRNKHKLLEKAFIY